MMKATFFFSLLFSTASAFTVTTPKAFTSTRRFKIDQIRRTTPLFNDLNSDDNKQGWDDGTKGLSTMVGGAGVSNAGEPPFEIRGFSLGNAVLFGGLAVTVLSFWDYLGNSGSDGLTVSGLGFVYGIPIMLAGAALKYAEIKPVESVVYNGAEGIFDAKATETLKKIKQDVTRHRYGDEAHLDTTVKKLGLVVPGKAYPQLMELREENEGGELAFSIVWQSLDTPYKLWADEKRVKKYETYFGPGLNAQCVKIDAEKRLVAIRLTTGEKKEEEPKPAKEESSVEA
ncbi:hypothetical protein TrCOL_g8062 [Triparma columacea]|uniref:Uncharacterized protein n=1 Tax=Triparma columacea TaxID=722753 RepID=A0A9W7GQ36_9STRA|nr:hypothetical protein TrCOL_g8062 [Triparma columacea]